MVTNQNLRASEIWKQQQRHSLLLKEPAYFCHLHCLQPWLTVMQMQMLYKAQTDWMKFVTVECYSFVKLIMTVTNNDG